MMRSGIERVIQKMFTHHHRESDRVKASPEMRWALKEWGMEDFTMEPEQKVRSWYEQFYKRHPFTQPALDYFRSLRLESYDLSQEWGGGYWMKDSNLVVTRGSQQEGILHELSHAFWEYRRLENNLQQRLMDAVVQLAQETEPQYKHTVILAGYYVNGIPTQIDPKSPTGYWRGMLVEKNDHEMFAGLASGTMGDMRLLPPYAQSFYKDLFVIR